METAVYAKVILASPEEIDRVNILNATKNAMALAAKDAPCDLFLVDAITKLDVPGEVRGLVHGDALCYSIAAASIFGEGDAGSASCASWTRSIRNTLARTRIRHGGGTLPR